MKLVIAIIKPFKLDEVREALSEIGVQGMTAVEAKGFGRQKSYLDQYDDSEFSQAFLPKVEISMWVDEARVGEIVRKVMQIARTGRIGDGKVFVIPAESYERIIDI